VPLPISDAFLSLFPRYGHLLKPSIENCGPTAADGDMVTIDSLYHSALSDGTIANPLRLTV